MHSKSDRDDARDPDAATAPGTELTWSYPRSFWIANIAELFERAAYYGMMIALAVYLTREIGFSDVHTGYVAAAFAAGLNLLPTFSGIVADQIGFRRAMLLAFALLTVGYAQLGLAGQDMFTSGQAQLIATSALLIVMAGGSIIKPVISGTVAQTSNEINRARAFSIFYAMVNIGAFSGKFVAGPLRQKLGLEYINFYAAIMAFAAFLFILLLYSDVQRARTGRTMKDALAGLFAVLRNGRFLALILIVAGFWTIQTQLYASMPKYILRLQGEQASPEWLANINPFVVVLFVVPVTHLVRRMKAESSIAIALLLIPLSALTMALSSTVSGIFGSSLNLSGIVLEPITLMVIIGIAIQGFAECFLSPKYLEFASRQAPPGQTGLYMGYSHLSSFFAYLFGFVISGYLLEWFCPDPAHLPLADHEQWKRAIAGDGPMPAQYQRAHYIWYVFAGIGVATFLALLAFKVVTSAIDRKRATTAVV